MTRTKQILREFTEASRQQALEAIEALTFAHALNTLGKTDEEFGEIMDLLNDHVLYCEEKMEALEP